VPLNTEAVQVLKAWRQAATDHDGYVFSGRADSDDGRLDDIKKS
jgi:hypothetical protein